MGDPQKTKAELGALAKLRLDVCAEVNLAGRSGEVKPADGQRGFHTAGHRCQHNLNYWQFGDYLGIGAGAHSKLSFPERILRQARYRQPREYMERTAAGDAVQTAHELTAKDVPFEFMMNALRLSDGFALPLFEERAGMPLVAALKGLDEAERRQLIVRDHERVAPTALGRRFLNDLLEIFLQ
jgi:oxygen-independent coproporphyrinogen-3 oxidase